MANVFAVPTTSVKVPKLVVPDTAAMVDVPVLTMLPLAKGVPAVGRTRRFCHVSEQVTALELAIVTSNLIWVEEMDVMAIWVPLLTPLMLRDPEPPPVSLVIKTVGAVPPVSNLNPAGAFR